MSAINLGYFRVLAIPRGMTHAHSQTSFRGNSDQNSFKLAIALSEDVRSLVAFLELLPRSFVIHT